MKITRSEYLQLTGIVALAERYSKMLGDLCEAAYEITKEEHDHGSGHTSDVVWGCRELDDALRILGITVEAPNE